MTNVLATNAIVPKKIDTPYFLKASKQGFPISGQVPRTYQRYTGTGNQTINYDGSNEITVIGQLLVGPLIIDLGPLQNIRNMVGRTLTLNIVAPINQAITINSSPAFMMINGTALQQLSHVIAGDNLSKSITIYFQSETYINVDYGASATASVVPSSLPEAISLSSTYVYGTFNTFTIPSVYIPDTTTYDVTFNALEPRQEGELVPITTTVTGPGTQSLSFTYTPSARRTAGTSVTGYLSSAGQYYGSFNLRINPILNNVGDIGFFTGANTNGTLAMYDILSPPGGARTAYDANGAQVNLGANLLCYTVDVEDSLVFYVLSTSNTTVRFFSYMSDHGGVLIKMSTLPVGYWTGGATILDMAYDDREHSLLVMPNNIAGQLCRIPILPYDVNNPTVVRTSNLSSRALTLPAGSTPYAMEVCPATSSLYFAYKGSVYNNTIQIYHSFNSMDAGSQYTHPTIGTGRTSLCINSRGQLIAHYEADNSVNYVANASGMSTVPGSWVTAFTAPAFYSSLSRNCYGWTSV